MKYYLLKKKKVAAGNKSNTNPYSYTITSVRFPNITLNYAVKLLPFLDLQAFPFYLAKAIDKYSHNVAQDSNKLT